LKRKRRQRHCQAGRSGSGPAGPEASIDIAAPEIRFAEMQPPPTQKRRINYKLGSIYAVVTALLVSVQEPFSFLAAKRLSVTQFVFLTQVALVMSIPLLMVSGKGRRDLVLLLGNAANYFKFGVLFLIGMAGLLLFKLGLSNAHPIIISAIINLQPFFAALVALLVARVPIPVSPAIFFGCLVSAFFGAMAIAWSQVGEANQPELSKLAESAMHGTWLYAVPVPICSALGGTLICKWFAKYDESAAIAANFFVSALVLIPAAGFFLYWRSELHFGQIVPVILMIAGTIIAASVGRVLYQIALNVTGADNGFVTMFFLLIPALTALISIPMSWWISDLHFAVSWMFYGGLFVVSASLLFFSLKSWGQPDRQ
jgi:drug/metabolite transporter (DMT)-like permease